jgi:hypothetical protein
MSKVDREVCRKAAAECVELARATADQETKQVLRGTRRAATITPD